MTTTDTTTTYRHIEDTAVAALRATTPIDATSAEAITEACQQYQTRDPLIHRILTETHPAARDHALNRIWHTLAIHPTDPELLTVAAVLDWSITGNTTEALPLLRQAQAHGTRFQLAALITQAITLGLPHDTWITMTADTTLDIMRSGTT